MGNIVPWNSKQELKEVLSFVDEFAVKKDYRWSWVKNWDCKYIDIRIDMRDGHFVMRDKEGKRISLEDLKQQREC